MRINIKIVLLVLFTLVGYAQSKKDLRNLKVKSLTITNISSSGIAINDAIEKYNKNGDVLEELSFDKDGKLKEKTTFKYNSEGDKIEKVTYDATGKLKSKEVYKYDKNGNKIEEQVFGLSLISKSVYVYNAKGLKKEKKTYDANSKLIHHKVYQYEY